jgi:hypothetical protein
MNQRVPGTLRAVVLAAMHGTDVGSVSSEQGAG